MSLSEFDTMLPGDVIRFPAHNSEEFHLAEAREAISFLQDLKRSYFVSELDYWPRELIRSRIEALIYEIERYDE